jgi:hypothetical protein
VRRTKATSTEVAATKTTTTEASSAAEVAATKTTTMETSSSTPAVASCPPGLSEGDRCDAD